MDDYAKDMGVWHVAMVFPQVTATPIAGFLLDNFPRVGKAQNVSNAYMKILLQYDIIDNLCHNT